MKNKIDVSRKKTPWDEKDVVSSTQAFIMEKYKENYELKHRKLSETNEHILINSIEVKVCPYCNSNKIKKNGKKNKIQKHYCNECKREFNPLTSTIFSDRKISITEWVEYCLDVFYYGSTSLISKVNKNSENTSSYWLHKLFLVLAHYQEGIVLKGNVYLDETFYKVIKSEVKRKKDGKELRGLSENQYCIGIACDNFNVIGFVEGVGKTSEKLTTKTFVNHIEKNSHLIHDKEKSHKELIKKLNLTSETYDSNELKGLDDKNNPLDKINNHCDLLKKFLNAHSGFDRKYLQDYVNLYCFISNNYKKSKLDKVEELLNLAINTKVTLKYRDFFKIQKESD